MVADIVADMVVNMEVHMLADMEVDKEADLAPNKNKKKKGRHGVGHQHQSTWKSNLVRELVKGVG